MRKFLMGALIPVLILGLSLSAFAAGSVFSDHNSTRLLFKERVAGSGAAVHFGIDGTGMDVKFFGASSSAFSLWDESADKWVSDGVDFHLYDNDELRFGDLTAGDTVMKWDGTDFHINPAADDKILNFGVAASTQLSWDLRWYGNTSIVTVVFDAGANEILVDGADIGLQDNDETQWGDDDDVTMLWDTDSFDVKPLADDQVLNFGIPASTQLSWDMNWYSNTSLDTVKFDAGANFIYIDGVDVRLYDDDLFQLGDSAEFQIEYDEDGNNDVRAMATGLRLIPSVDDKIFYIGEPASTQLSWDVNWYAETSIQTVKFDAGNADIVFDDVDLRLNDDDILQLGDAKDVSHVWDGTYDIKPLVDDVVINFGIPESTQLSWDMNWYANTSLQSVAFDAGAAKVTLEDVDLYMNDNDRIYFGDDGQEGSMYSNGSDMFILPYADDDILRFGVAAVTQLSWDMYWYAETSIQTVVFDAGLAKVTYEDVDQYMNDNDRIYFGDAGGEGSIYSDGSEIIITGAAIEIDDATTLQISSVTTAISGDVSCTGHVDGISFHVNAFQYPLPGTDWSPNIDGARLPDAKSAKIVYLPLNFLKVGDEIVSYTLVGDVVEASIATVDAQIYRINKADPITTSAIAGGAMTQVTADGNFDVLATLSAVETIATDKQYVIQITGTTTASDAITVMGAEVVINRKL